MKYRNAKDVLPPDLLEEIQKYSCGELMYVPKKESDKAHWGQISGIRHQVHVRNCLIVESYRKGAQIEQLMQDFCLSEASIRKIIYSGKAQTAGRS